MDVRIAKSAGFCFGVQRAVQLVYDEAEKETAAVCTLGPIIHNEFVVKDLEEKGVLVLDEDLKVRGTGAEPPSDSVIIIRSHGVSRALYEEIRKKGWRIVDATCPFVHKIHKFAAEKSAAGCCIVIIGNADHPEVKGIRGWVSGPCAVVETPGDVDRLDFPENSQVCIVSQTTFHFDKFQELVEIICKLGYHVIVENTICNATKERQTEALDLASQSDIMLVIGSRTSSNTQKLYNLCRSQCKNTYYIQKLDDLETTHFPSDSCVGITAGASTPNNIIQEVSQHVRGTEF